MTNLNHKYFRNVPEEAVRLRQLNRYSPDEEVIEVEKDYSKMSANFRYCIDAFNTKKRERIEKRTIQVPEHIDYIEIEFFNYFDRINFENRYINDFGIIPVFYSNLDKTVLFAIDNNDKFQGFIQEVENFINTENHTNPDYNPNIKYIQSFTFLSSEKILTSTENSEILNLNLIDDSSIYSRYFVPIFNNLINYLNDKSCDYRVYMDSKYIEIIHPENDIIVEIANNFDILYSITSNLSGAIRPSHVSTPIRDFGFNITNSDDELPIIGVIDSGVSNNNPLRDIIINDDEFDLTGTGSLVDNMDHGTGVAAIAALGKKVFPDYQGNFSADAKILPIKIIDTNSSYISESEVCELIRNAHLKHGIRIFTLTVGYQNNLFTNQKISEYAYKLDKLSYELDILIFISTSNRELENDSQYPDCFNDNLSNISSPAESMNNVTIGAIADNLENNYSVMRLSDDNNYPAGYSRRLHIDFDSDFFTQNQRNKNLKKPELVDCGGDYTLIEHQLFGRILEPNDSDAGLKVLSSEIGIFFNKSIGTSYSAPFSANLCSKLLKQYPDLNMVTLKAILINSAFLPRLNDSFSVLNNYTRNNLIGYGIPDEIKSLYSNENMISLILEDTIEVNTIKAYPINLPLYLNNLQKENSLLTISATLCYKIPPHYKSQLSYCPIYMAFGFFKNYDLNNENARATSEDNPERINNNSTDNIKIKSGLTWSEDYYYKNKLVSNTQKISFSVRKTDLLNENNTFKIVIKSLFHKLLTEPEKQTISSNNLYSLVITITENPVKGKLSNHLYNEINLINRLENIIELETDLELNN